MYLRALSLCVFRYTTKVSGHSLTAPGDHPVWCTVVERVCVCVTEDADVSIDTAGKRNVRSKRRDESSKDERQGVGYIHLRYSH